MASNSGLESNRPAKRARLARPSSPALSTRSDSPIDDEDLYDEPVKTDMSLMNMKREEVESENAYTTRDDTPVGEIPGLGLLGPSADEPHASHLKVEESKHGITNGDVPVQKATPKRTRSHSNTSSVDSESTLPPAADGKEIKPEASAVDNAVVDSHEQADGPAPPAGEDTIKHIKQEAITDADEKLALAAQENNDDENAEWEHDSSAESTSDSDSDSSSSDSDSDDEGYQLLGPEEQARILMQGEGGSDDEGGGRNKGISAQLRTTNERPEEIVEKPNVTVTAEMTIIELGIAENIVENYVVIKAALSGEYQVLDSGSVLCLQDRTVFGAVAEPLGRVEEPYYSVAFTNAADIQACGIEKGTKVFYVPDHSSYVFTQPLKAIKGSDASNIHDEEIGADELEFSDDEAEAEFKRKLKQEKQAKKFQAAPGGPDHGFKGPAKHSTQQRIKNEYPAKAIKNEYPAQGMNYDDDEGDDLYTPLARPDNLHNMAGPGGPPIERDRRGGAPRGRGGPRGDRGRGDRFNRRGRGQYNGTSSRQESHDGPRDESRPAAAPMPPQTAQSHESAQHAVPPPMTPGFQNYAGQPEHRTSHSSQPWPQNAFGGQAYHPNTPQSPPVAKPSTPGGSIPAGAFVNPAFFANNAHSPSFPPQSQPASSQYQYPQPYPPQQYSPQQYSPQQPSQQQFPPQYQPQQFQPQTYPPHQFPPQPYPPQQPYQPYQQYGYQMPQPTPNSWHNQPLTPQPPQNAAANGRGSPESEAAFRAAQEKLSILRELNSKSGSP